MDETLRAAVAEALRHRSQTELAARAGLHQATISRFLAGRDISLSAASKLAAAVGLELRQKKISKK